MHWDTGHWMDAGPVNMIFYSAQCHTVQGIGLKIKTMDRNLVVLIQTEFSLSLLLFLVI